ncbi:MAG: hypothetical protein H6752_21755 [Candidatus Omnitrophica bacterium]|nr:hypothetical protein [Candidatus Omnitrophota bacterium]
MTTKETAIRAIEDLPEDSSWEEILERIRFISSVQQGLAELDAGKGVPDEDIKKEISEWRELQCHMSERASELGIKTEDDVDRLIHEFRTNSR